jgi:ATP-dependent DNA helicase RecQ
LHFFYLKASLQILSRISVSEWGHEFRPDYRRIGAFLRGTHPHVPIMALTATATSKV